MESPETKLTAEFLSKTLVGKNINEWCFISGSCYDNMIDECEYLVENLPIKVEEISYKGNLIFFTLSNHTTKLYITHSLRSCGSWQNYMDEDCRWYFTVYEDNRCVCTLYFHNSKYISHLSITDNPYKIIKTKETMGPDIFSLDLPEWKKLVNQHKNKNICQFLTNQTIMSGCGNYIKSEALYYAKLSPSREMISLKENEIEKLFEGIRIISRLSYLYKGLNYHDEDGNKGQFDTQLKIYKQENAEKIKTLDGFITYWDPKHQS